MLDTNIINLQCGKVMIMIEKQKLKYYIAIEVKT